MVGLSVLANKTGPVHSENHMQFMHTNILHDLIIRALQESRIQGYNRDHPLLRKTTGHGNGVFLRNTHIKDAPGEFRLEIREACTVRHSGGYGTNSIIFCGNFANFPAKSAGEGLLCRALYNADLRIEPANAVIGGGSRLRRGIALTLLGVHMQQDRTLHSFGQPQ